MKILVVGGAGYIGSHTVRMLVDEGVEVCVFDNLESGHLNAIDLARVGFFRGDIRRKEDLRACIKGAGFDACILFAGYIVSSESVAKPEKYFENNCTGALNLLDVMVECGMKSIVFSSSCSVYGTTDKVPLNETLPEHPESPYAESKLIVERYLKWYCSAHDMGAVALRYFNAAGAHPDGNLGQDFSPVCHLIPIAVEAAMGKRAAMNIYGTDFPTPDGTCVRDYIHICDLARAHVLALEKLCRGERGHFVYNCGVGRGYSVREVIEKVKEISGRDFPVAEAPPRPGDPAMLYSDNSLITKDLGWKPVFDLDAIVRTAWNWHSSHPEGLRGKGRK